MNTTSKERLVLYWVGYHESPTIQLLAREDVVNFFCSTCLAPQAIVMPGERTESAASERWCAIVLLIGSPRAMIRAKQRGQSLPTKESKTVAHPTQIPTWRRLHAHCERLSVQPSFERECAILSFHVLRQSYRA
jgi:hypothetical protein